MRHSHELRRFLARQTDSQDTPTDRGKLNLRVLCHAEGETIADPYAVLLHKTAVKLAKNHRRRRSAWFRRTIAKPAHR
jgi:hypothetical protein